MTRHLRLDVVVNSMNVQMQNIVFMRIDCIQWHVLIENI